MERVVLDKSRCGWWKSAVFYELYPKSFQDTTGSGTGDLRGILSHLDYLETLGVDAIWLCPICASPQVDNGYDISDFCAIEPSFGTMADMDELIAESKKRGIGSLIDLTLNHCSDQHRWFRAAPARTPITITSSGGTARRTARPAGCAASSAVRHGPMCRRSASGTSTSSRRNSRI